LAKAATETTQQDGEFRTGWPAVLACFCMALLAWGFGLYGQSVYLAELTRVHHWSTGLISAANTWCWLAGALAMTRVPGLIARFGPRAVLIGGSLLIAGGAWLETRVAAPWQLFAATTIIALGWAGSSSVAIATTLALWFDRRRGFALSLAQNGASVAGFTVAPALVALVAAWGLRPAVGAVLAGLLALVLPLLWFALRAPPLAPQHRPGLQTAALRDPRFWAVSGPFALAMTAQVGFIVHQVPFLLPQLGPGRTAWVVAAATLAAVLGRIALGTVIDRLNQRAAAAASMALQALGMVLMLALPAPATLVAGMLLFSVSVGNMITLPPLVVARAFPPASYAAVVGLNGAVVQVCFAFGPGLLGPIHDARGGYDAVLATCAAFQLLAAAIMLRGARWAAA
jgi:predicted MFS family arabinose efflux permease